MAGRTPFLLAPLKELDPDRRSVPQRLSSVRGAAWRGGHPEALPEAVKRRGVVLKPSQRLCALRSSSLRIGFGMKSFIPAARHASRSLAIALAVSAVIGRCRPFNRARILRVASTHRRQASGNP